MSDAGAAPGNLLLVHSACLVTPGSENRANDHKGSPGNLGDPVVSIEQGRREHRQTNSRMIHGPRPGPRGTNNGTKRWYRQAKETKCGEKDGRESERLIVPPSRGNHPEGTPGREGDAVS